MNHDLLDQELKKEKNLHLRPIIIFFAVIFIGILFKTLHWPGSSIIIITSTAGLLAFSVNCLIFITDKKVLSISITILGVVWTLFIIGGMLFNQGHPFNINGLLIYLIVFAIYSITYYFIFRKKYAL